MPKLGFHHLEETKKRMSISHKGKPTKGGRKKGYTHTEDTKRKISNAKKGVKATWIAGEKSRFWKGGKYHYKKGYVAVKAENHPFKNASGYVMEHRLVMEKMLGRYLNRNEEVHHKNKIKDDNRPENLEIVLKAAHWGIITCPSCQKEFKIK